MIYERFEVDFDLGVDGQLANQMGCWHFVIYIVVDVWHFSVYERPNVWAMFISSVK